jgi:hypothetical protein
MAIVLVICPAFHQIAQAEQTALHVVSGQELKEAVAAKLAQRASDMQEVQNLLQHEVVQRQVGRLLDLTRIERRLSTLDDETLNQLAAESRRVNDQFQAGLPFAILLAIVAGGVAALIIILASDDDSSS